MARDTVPCHMVSLPCHMYSWRLARKETMALADWIASFQSDFHLNAGHKESHGEEKES